MTSHTHTHQDWPYPGSRWWKFDFHTHTPASADTYWGKHQVSLSSKEWLQRYMDAGIDCVAITDHNSGAMVDDLKAAYARMKEQADAGTPPDGFRELTLFPGVELSVQGGFHLLAIFDPNTTTSTIDTLLGQVNYGGTKGDSDGVTREGAAEVVRIILNNGGIPIPAHADRPGNNGKGLLAVHPGTQECQLDANTVRQILDTDGLLAVEWEDMSHPLPDYVRKQSGKLARVLGSDCHSFQGKSPPGSRYTWIKMACPTLEGLRLALLDGNGISIRRSDDNEEFEPFQTPAHFITGMEIESARFMGNGTAEKIVFTPYYNALIGGRGTGKSTVVHSLRLACRREDELRHLEEKTEPYRQFRSFSEPVRGRDGTGALREDTEIRVELMRERVVHRLRWRQDSKGPVVEEQDENGDWQATDSQAINAERFPIRLYSQGQIAAMAGDSRQALIDVIDEAANIGELHRALSEARNTYFSQRAKLRELDGKLAGKPELQRRLTDLDRKSEALAQSDHAEILKTHQQALRQRREIDTTLSQLQTTLTQIKTLPQDLLLDDWPDGAFDAVQDGDVLAWRVDAGRLISETREELERVAGTLAVKVQALATDERLDGWRQSADQARIAYEKLQAELVEQGVTGPQAFGNLMQERHQLEAKLKQFDQLHEERERVRADSEVQYQRLSGIRRDITQARTEFVVSTLAKNDFVRIKIIGFGFDARNIERSLRDVLNVEDGRFEHDILRDDSGMPAGGLAFDLAQAEGEAKLADIKQRLIDGSEHFHGHFNNYLDRMHEKPEFADHIRCWFPEDDLQIEYSRSGDGRDWSAITQGSQGQRSAALLAFLLAFGDDPLVLDQPEDDLDNHLIYELIVRQIRENKLRRQLIIVTHNPNVVVNGDAEMVHAFDFVRGQCQVTERGALQEKSIRDEVCGVMEGGREAFARRWARLGREV